VKLPFDPGEAWGQRARFHVNGTIGGFKVRGPLSGGDGTFHLHIGAAWLRDYPLHPGDTVDVALEPEGPQNDALDEDIAAALAAAPQAQRFFEALATFYRKAYLTWLAGAKRRPELRKARIQEFVALLEAGKKSR
jgi:hypothetical protein